MKKMRGMFVSLAVILVLVACGQSNMTNEELNNNAGGANLDTNEETVNENENENENIQANNDNSNTVDDNEEVNNSNEEKANEEIGMNEEEVAMMDSVTLFFSDDQLMEMYRVASDLSVTSDEAGALEVMNLWASGPTLDGLYPLLPEGTRVEFVEFRDGVAHVSFSDELNDANLGSSGHKMLTEQITLMLEQFGYDRTQIMISGEEVGEFQGHMDLSEPIEAGNPEDYDWME